MKIILPPHKKCSSKVKNYEDIFDEAKEICKNMQNGSFIVPGSKYNSCYAVAHCQVSYKPLRFFIINPMTGLEIIKTLGGLAIINPRILSKDKSTAIMSKEGCLSFPFRNERKVKRFNKIIVTYDFIKDLKDGDIYNMQEIEIVGLTAIVFQHELEHLNGKNIWKN